MQGISRAAGRAVKGGEDIMTKTNSAVCELIQEVLENRRYFSKGAVREQGVKPSEVGSKLGH